MTQEPRQWVSDDTGRTGGELGTNVTAGGFEWSDSIFTLAANETTPIPPN
jgi:hypothetical protein